MPRSKTPPSQSLLDPVIKADRAMKLAHATYKRSQDDFLQALRDARNGGETLTNLADALQLSKQWIHKFTTHGHDHNKVTRKRTRSDEDETPLGGSTEAPALLVKVVAI